MVLPNGGLPRKRGNPAAHDLTGARPDRCTARPTLWSYESSSPGTTCHVPIRQGYDKYGDEYDSHIQS